jgi:hypothetical protein
MNDEEQVQRERPEDDAAAHQKLPGSKAPDRSDGIPVSGDGVGLGAGTEANTFEPEEDPEATDDENASG